MTRIFLTGFMGAGKTTLGRAFTRETGLSFIDLDWYIEARFHRSISTLFSERGEAGFRETERAMLHEVAEFEDVLVATGGGTPCFFDNMDYMNSCGETVYIDVPIDILFRRLKTAAQQRPVLGGRTDDELRDFIAMTVAEREPFYRKARYSFDGSYLENRRQIADSVQLLRSLLQV